MTPQRPSKTRPPARTAGFSEEEAGGDFDFGGDEF